ncbi:hypothetical protein EJ04DRAFT_580707 [Polyplosphaeria fusca]|uniref:Uncharacterized protein n=1 Tax=Polyplosphaeria fusca TaxID=682080 RepID=A0A9P4QR08_9PLEO|nr:hypothetical protein EJ04DRAFT_580707 [Polyplosphaeria fusca]
MSVALGYSTCAVVASTVFIRNPAPKLQRPSTAAQSAMGILSDSTWPLFILLLLSAASLPQIIHLISKRESTGMSTYYLLFNLICATEQFTLAFFFVKNDIDSSDFFVHSLVKAGDYVNVAQNFTVLLSWLLLYVIQM